jgi:hypothetical protein
VLVVVMAFEAVCQNGVEDGGNVDEDLQQWQQTQDRSDLSIAKL